MAGAFFSCSNKETSNSAEGFNVFKSHPAQITMYGLNSASLPKIYYNSGFSTTGTNECTATTDPACTNITYSSGTLTFNVNHFSIFWVALKASWKQ
jgi:hypothetical protein